jgi:hypothetical protein
MTQHLAGQSVTELMGTTRGRLDPGTRERVPNEVLTPLGPRKPAHRSLGAQKDPPTRWTRSPVPQLADDRISDILR